MNQTPRILVIDDDPVLGSFDAQVLAGAGFAVDTAEDGEAGWNALETREYDLVITDNNMPKITGIELIKRLRGEGRDLPVIMISGALPSEEVQRSPGMRLSAALAKPFTAAQLVGAVRTVLHQELDAA